MHRSEVVNRLIDAVGAATYLEIGVAWGETFHAVRAPMKLGVDPGFGFRVPARRRWARVLGIPRGEHHFAMDSDSFFERHARLLERHPIDVALVDGLHEAEQASRDIENCLRHLSPSGVVVLHDCKPATAAAAAPSLHEAMQTEGFTGEWNGDVYRSVLRLRRRHPDLGVCVLDTDHGVGLVSNRFDSVPLAADLGDDIDYPSFRDRSQEVLNLRPVGYLEELVSNW